MGYSFAEEELVFFIPGQLSLIGEQAEKTGYDCRPDNEQKV